MKLAIDREADALYLDLDESLSYESQEIAPGVILDNSKDGKVVGIDMLYLSKRFDRRLIQFGGGIICGWHSIGRAKTGNGWRRCGSPRSRCVWRSAREKLKCLGQGDRR